MRNALIFGLAGLLSAVAVDLDAWRKSLDEDGKVAKFSWRVALLRWAYGFVTGFGTGLAAMEVGS